MKNAKIKNHLPAWTLFLLLISATFCNGQFKVTPSTKTMKSSGYAPVNGLKMYYEIHGEGKPLVVLHGSYMTIDMNWGHLLPELVKNRKVIALEMQGHGRTADRKSEFTYPQLADDVAGLLKHLKIDSADVLGYSLGGTVALETAIRHPEIVNKLIIISSVYKLEGWVKAARDLFPTITADMFENTPLKTEYDRLAPDKSHWREFIAKGVRLDSKDFDLGAENVRAIKSPALLISGDNDGVDQKHLVEMYSLFDGGVMGDIAGLPKSQLAIIPGMTHVNLIMQTEQLSSLINAFLNPPAQTAKQH
jgi:pimeloyl-ACP methyl ester carboxylesterase